MAARAPLVRADPGFSLPVLQRLAPAPQPALLAARVESSSAPGDVVLDLHGRGGWVARAAIDRQRRAVSLESSPLTRLLAEVVLRPPDLRHLDAAFQALSASPRGESSLKLWIGERFATRCATCGRSLVADEISWEVDRDGEGTPAPVRKHYRCVVCRDQQGGSEHRQAPLDEADRQRVAWNRDAAAARSLVRERFPSAARDLVDELLDLHTPRQLAALQAILARIEGDLRAAPIEAALRLAFLHAILPASRLQAQGGRTSSLRVASGHVRLPTTAQWRERNPWIAFEDGYRLVRGFVQRLEGGPIGPVQARLGEDVRSLGEGAATTVLRVGSPTTLGALEVEALDPRAAGRPRIRLVIGQSPVRPSQERLALALHGTAWALGREAAESIPVAPLLAASWQAPWDWQSAALRRSLEAVAPLLARDCRIILLVESSGPEALTAAALGGVAAGYRLVEARLGEPDDDTGGFVELAPPGSRPAAGPRTRANVPLPLPGGAGEATTAPGAGLFAPPERFDARPFSAAEATQTVTATAIQILRARGEPARTDRLLGEILVGLDRAGQLRRLMATEGEGEPEPPRPAGPSPRAGQSPRDPGMPGVEGSPALPPGGPGGSTGATRGTEAQRVGRTSAPGTTDFAGGGGPGGPGPHDQVGRIVELVQGALRGGSGRRRLVEIEPDRWWLAEREDRETAAPPLADRVEWAVYSLLSTAGPIPEVAFFQRIAAMFTGHDLPDEMLVRACLESYRSRASTADRLLTSESLPRRSGEHSELLAGLAEAGHRLGMRVWLGRKEQSRRVEGRPLGEWLDAEERDPNLRQVSGGPVEDLEAVDCIWYLRSAATLMFEVEWTAMLGETLLRRHARLPQEDRIVRFLAIPPERTELVRYKLDRSPLLRAALLEGNWHVLKWSHLRAFLAREPLDLADLEPYLGLDPVVERTGEQLPLFGE